MAFKPKTNPTIPTLGVIELNSVARGLVVCDAMLKKAEVRVRSGYYAPAANASGAGLP